MMRAPSHGSIRADAAELEIGGVVQSMSRAVSELRLHEVLEMFDQ